MNRHKRNLRYPNKHGLEGAKTNGAHARDDCALLSAFFQLLSLLYFTLLITLKKWSPITTFCSGFARLRIRIAAIRIEPQLLRGLHALQ